MRSGWHRPVLTAAWGLAVLLALPAAWAQQTSKKVEQPPTKEEAKGLHVEDALTNDLPTDTVRPGRHHRVHTFRMEAGATYTIDLVGRGFDAYLRLEDASGKGLAEDDDSGRNQNSRIVFTAPSTETYRLIATTFGA